MGNVDHAGEDHMFVIFIAIKCFKEIFKGRCGEFAVCVRKAQNFVTGIFHGSGFMPVNMSGRCGDDALIPF